MDLRTSTKEDAIREIVQAMANSGKVKDAGRFTRSILRRESLGSTGIGFGVAIPHARTECVEGFVIGFGRSRTGIDFQSLDGEKVHLIFLMGANPRDLNLYLRLLAELSRLLMNPSFRKELLSAVTCEELINIFKKYET
jgi:fructose-specific phosphotransferase system IIA component